MTPNNRMMLEGEKFGTYSKAKPCSEREMTKRFTTDLARPDAAYTSWLKCKKDHPDAR